jgi:hypothetical protein
LLTDYIPTKPDKVNGENQNTDVSYKLKGITVILTNTNSPKYVVFDWAIARFHYRSIKSGSVLPTPMTILKNISMVSSEEKDGKKQKIYPIKSRKISCFHIATYFVPADFLALAACPVGFSRAA